MKHIKYQQELGATAACTKRIMEATKGIGKKSIKGGTKHCLLFNSWFASKKAEEATMEVSAELIGMVKTNTRGFCKETIQKLTKDWPGGSYLLLRSKHMVPGDRPLIYIGYKYNAQKVLSFVFTDNAWSTKTGIPCLSKYPEQFTNVVISPVSRPLVVSKQYSVNQVDSHNKSRQSYLALEKWWVTQFGWLSLCTAVAMGITITNFWKLFSYRVKSDHYEKLICIR